MGISDAMLAFYTDLKKAGLLNAIDSVAELGSQTVWVQNPERLTSLFLAFGRTLPSDAEFAKFINSSGTGIASSRSLHEYLGFRRYTAIDIDETHGAIAIDLNFDEVPEEHRGAYGLVTNHGTAEHIINQANVFKAIHDLAAPGGLILSVSPFIGWVEHGFFNYQPNFFQALARFNAYEVLGMWVNHDPWAELVSLLDDGIKKFSIELGHNYLIVSLFRKTSDAAFFMPVQGHYEAGLPPASRARYRHL